MADSGTGHSDPTIPFPPLEPHQTPYNPNRKKRLLLGFGGCGLFVCFVVLLTGGLFIYTQGGSNFLIQADLPIAVQSPTLKTDLTPVIEPSPISQVISTNEKPIIETANPSATLLATEPATNTLQFGDICFRPVVEGGEILGCGNNFSTTVYEVHVIFDYQAMRPQEDTWTRIWYHNRQPVLTVEELWNGDTNGQFDYNLNTSDAQPLSPGTWELELYVNNVLQTYEAFIINPIEPELPTTTPTAEEPAIALNPVITPANNYTLAFTKWDGSKHSLWTSDLDGNNQRWLLDFAASPSWSPDGQQLAFYGEEGIDTQEQIPSGTNGIWTINPVEENPTQLLAEGSTETVTWSPQGDSIAFDAARGGPDRRIYFIDQSGNPLPFETLGEQPSLSPDGNTLVAKVCRPDCGLWIVNRDDSSPRQLTAEGSDGLPAWSPDGAKIAFSRNVDDNVDIYTINPDGSNLTRLTSAPGNDSVPAWTPDSRQIVFRSTREGLWQIYVMNADGTDQHLIIDNVGASDEWAFDQMSVK